MKGKRLKLSNRLPRSVTVSGERFRVRLACGRLFFRNDGGEAREVDYFMDYVERDILIARDVPPRWRDFVLLCAVERAEEGPSDSRRAA